MKSLTKAICFTTLCMLGSFPVAAQSNADSDLPLGIRAGYTTWNQLDQIHVGAHVDAGELVPNVVFIPGFELGFGDSARLLTVNGDVVYEFTELTTRPWGLYGGGSLSFNYWDPERGDSSTDLGISGLAGMTYEFAGGHQMLFEVRVGLMDSPDLKFTVGYSLF